MSEQHKFPSQMQDRFIVRFPEGMRDRLKAAAKANCRSLNSEIIHRLGMADSGAPIPLSEGKPAIKRDKKGLFDCARFNAPRSAHLERIGPQQVILSIVDEAGQHAFFMIAGLDDVEVFQVVRNQDCGGEHV